MANPSIEVFHWLGFIETSTTPTEYIGTCPFCGKPNKFYINQTTLQWSCKAGHCQREGNLYGFISERYNLCKFSTTSEHYQTLEMDRFIPENALRKAGLVWYAERQQWLIPVLNKNKAIVNLRVYTPRKPKPNIYGLPTLETFLYRGGELDTQAATVYVTEGEWDAIALRDLLVRGATGREPLPEDNAIVVAVPGAGVFKDEWVLAFSGKTVYLCYDADVDGLKGREKAIRKLAGVAKQVAYLQWPDETPDKYDIRDFYIECRTYIEFRSLFVACGEGQAEQSGEKTARSHVRETFVDEMGGQKPAFNLVLEIYKKHLTVTPDYEMAIRVAFATILSKWIPGDPLWVYLVGPPSSGKTLVLLSVADSKHCVLRSNLTAASLVSGFRTGDGKDPSLLPQLNGKVFVMKDFTEVLKLPVTSRDEIYSTLRGAYDGSVERQFGNGIMRNYQNLHFAMLAGVTPEIYGQREASLGERFLMLHIIKGTDYENDTVLRALENVGKDANIMDELAAVASTYLDFEIDDATISDVVASFPEDFNLRIAGLAQLVAILRGEVRYDFKGERMLYRPQFEVGARLAKQLRKLALSLALLEDPIGYNDNVMRIVGRVAFDTCVGFNLEVIQAVMMQPNCTISEMHEMTAIPMSTLRSLVDDLIILEALHREKKVSNERGAPEYQYRFSEKLITFWSMAGLDQRDYTPDTITKIRKRRKRG